MAAHFKAIDTNHLLTIGEEGFYPRDSAQWAANPQGTTSWAFEEGQHFLLDHAVDAIDYCHMHLWPHNWQDAKEGLVRTWIQQHIEDAKALNKPLVGRNL
jgi:mannan endo-1,4-beta-mannosidase